AAAPVGADPGRAVEAMVQRLADRLASQPEDVEGWRRLARAYETLERHEAAARAYRQLLRLQPQDADALCELALVLALQQGDLHLKGEAASLVQQALQADPRHLQALALAGGIALEEGRAQEARRLWQRVLDQVPPGTELARNIQASIDRTGAARP
ncbi:MAG TPA: tetratricopeptide repeat protein, partial [Burkholderiaceae bacterium]|nr:tetratricopeptide repeat protein [Burkholderiaceae bacterium]